MSGPQPGTPTPWEAHQGVLPEQHKVWDITAKTDGWRRSSECPQGYFVATVHETLNAETAAADAAAIVHRMNNWDAVVKALEGLVASVDALIADSEGVYGLHLNGDLAPWNDLVEGGRFEDWLIQLETARAALTLAKSGGNS